MDLDVLAPPAPETPEEGTEAPEETICTLSPDAIEWMQKSHLIDKEMVIDLGLLNLSYTLAHERTSEWTQSKHLDIIKQREMQRNLQRVNVGLQFVELCLIEMDKEGFQRILDANQAQ
ncbi:MAG TPA: hypothetical protein VKE92_01695 [Anaerolineales bacterium]|nr:hypothetical protein [Anaerolineales bacterium]